MTRGKAPLTTQICSHDEDQFVTSAEGTSYCPSCAAAVPDDSVEFYEGTLADGFDDDPGSYDPRPDPRTHPEFWTE